MPHHYYLHSSKSAHMQLPLILGQGQSAVNVALTYKRSEQTTKLELEQQGYCNHESWAVHNVTNLTGLNGVTLKHASNLMKTVQGSDNDWLWAIN